MAALSGCEECAMSMSQAPRRRSRSPVFKWIIVVPLLAVSCILAGGSIRRYAREEGWIDYYAPENVAARKVENERRLQKERHDAEIKAAIDRAAQQIMKLGGKCDWFKKKSGFLIDQIDLSQWRGTDQDLEILSAFLLLQKGNDRFSLTMPPTATDSSLGYLEELTNLEHLGLSKTSITDNGLNHLRNLTELKTIDLSHTAISDVGLDRITMHELWRIDLSGANVTRPGIARWLQRHPEVGVTISGGSVSRNAIRLEGPGIGDASLGEFSNALDRSCIELLKTNVTDAGLDVLRRQFHLERLSVDGSPITDLGLRQVKGHRSLTALSFDGTRISDAGLRDLEGMVNLSSLGLEGTQITDAGLVHLSGLMRIEYLNLAHTNIGDSGLEHLAPLTAMRQLVLQGTRITNKGLNQLKGMAHLKELDLRETQVARDHAKTFQEGMPELYWIMLNGHDLWDHDKGKIK